MRQQYFARGLCRDHRLHRHATGARNRVGIQFDVAEGAGHVSARSTSSATSHSTGTVSSDSTTLRSVLRPADQRAQPRAAFGAPVVLLPRGGTSATPRPSPAGEGIPPDALIHLAAKAGVRPSVADPQPGYADVNVHGTIRMLEWARARKVPKVLFASSSSVYGGNTKVPFPSDDSVDRSSGEPLRGDEEGGGASATRTATCTGMNVVALRFFTVYGPRQRPEMAIHKFTRRILIDTRSAWPGLSIEWQFDGPILRRPLD